MSEPQSILERIEARGRAAPRLLLPGSPDPSRTEGHGRYALLGEIAHGGVGTVYRGRDMDLGRDVAMKVLRDEHMGTPDIVERFVGEAQIAGQLQHPGIVPVYELGLAAGKPFFAMKLVKGETLAEILARGKDPRILAIFEQACRTVAYAHARGVVHRDLKPSNIMVGAFGEVQVLDWGFAKVLGRGGVADERRARRPEVTRIATVGSASVTGSLMGTPAYMPPEQALGLVEELDERSDVFALGAILCEILTGKPPYVGDPEDVLLQASQARLDDTWARLEACGAEAEVVRIARACLSPLPKDRLASAKEVGGALGDHLASAEARAHRSRLDAIEADARAAEARGAAEHARVAAVAQRRGRMQTVALAAVLLLLIVGGGGGWLWVEGDRRERARETALAVEAAVQQAAAARGRDWPAARAAAERAVELSRGIDADDATRVRAVAFGADIQRACGEAEAAAALAAENAALIDRLTEIRLHLADDLDPTRTDAEYAEAFLSIGVDAERLDAAEAARLVRARGDLEAVDLAAALDDWARLRSRRRNLAGREWKKLAEIAIAADPDEFRCSLRAAVAEGVLDKLRALAASDETRKLPPVSLALVGHEIALLGDRDAAASLLRAAALKHPGDFWINLRLAQAVVEADPAEAARYGTAALAARPQSVEARHQLGIALERAGDADGAIAVWRDAARLKPDYGHVLAHVGDVLTKRGEVETALEVIRQALQLDPDDAWAHDALGRVLDKKGLFEEAIASHRESIRLRPDLPAAYHNLGNAFFRKGLLDEAIEQFRAAIRIRPLDADSHGNLAVALDKRGLFEDAIAEYREAIRLKPDYHEAIHNLGNTLADRGLLDQAITAHREAVRLAPDDSANHQGLAVALRRKGMGDEAIAEFREAIRLDPRSPGAHGGLGDALSDKGLLDEAIVEYRETIRLRPADAEAWNNLAIALEAKGLPDEAIAGWREAIRIDPGLGVAHFNLGNAFLEKGLPDEAIAVSREAIRLLPADGGPHVNLGRALLEKRLPDQAITEFRTAARLNPSDAGAYFYLGNALASKGLLDEAIPAWRETVRLEPRAYMVRCNLGIALEETGFPEAGIAEVREANRRLPGDPDILQTLGWLLANCADARFRDPEEAVALARRAVEGKPLDPKIRNTLGVALFRAGNDRDAVAALEETLDLAGGKGGVASTLVFLAMAKWRLGEKDEARTLLERAVKRGNDDPEFRRNRAEAEALMR